MARLRVVVEGVESSWKPVTSGGPQGSALGPVMFNILIYDLNNGIEIPLSQSEGDTILGWSLGLLKSGKALQREMNGCDRSMG